jgi:hypothetical protein
MAGDYELYDPATRRFSARQFAGLAPGTLPFDPTAPDPLAPPVARRPAAAAAPVVFNGPDQVAPLAPLQATGVNGPVAVASPVRDDVIRAMGGGRGGQMPTVQDFLRSMPQSAQMDFSAGSGRMAGPSMSLGAPVPHDTYVGASQGPLRTADHTANALNAYANLLSQYTTGPESPTQAAARIMQQQSHALEAESSARHREAQTGIAQAGEDRLRWQEWQRLSPEGRRAQAEAYIMQQPGMTPEIAQRQMAEYVRRGFFGPAAAAMPATPWAGRGAATTRNPGPSAGGALPAPTGNVTAPTPNNAQGAPIVMPNRQTPTTGGAESINPYETGANRDPGRSYDAIRSVLDEAAADPAAGRPAPGSGGRAAVGTIGEMIARLERSRPGFAAANMPAITAYLRDNFPEGDYDRARYGVVQSAGGYYDPFMSRGFFGRLAHPLLAAGQAIGNATMGGQMSQDQQGRALLATYLRNRARP